MHIVIGSARYDENGKYVNGQAGDNLQVSSTNDAIGEVSMQPMYVHKYGWYISRPKLVTHANVIAERMKIACNNPNVGYDQNGRYGIITYGVEAKVKTESDCSSLVRQCVKEATGIDPGDFTTANEVSKLEETGLFEEKVKYVSQDKTPVYDGDILTSCRKGHTVIVVSGNPRPITSSTTSTSTTNNFVSNGVNYSLVFNPTYYANKYADLKKAFGTDEKKLFNHFVKYGMKEARQACNNFNVASYKSRYKDLQKAFGDNLPAYYKHYVQYGYKEGRNALIDTASTNVNSSISNTKTIYRVQIGSYSVKANADKLLAEVKKKGYTDAFVKTSGKYYKVQLGAYSVKTNADKMLAQLKKLGYSDAFITM